MAKMYFGNDKNVHLVMILQKKNSFSHLLSSNVEFKLCFNYLSVNYSKNISAFFHFIRLKK